MIKSNAYDELLLNLIPNLEGFESKSGVEGTAYFVDDNFVVKKIQSSVKTGERDELWQNFGLFCDEIKNYADLGYAVPKIYSWVGIPAHTAQMDSFVFYVLEERIPGEILFEQRLHKIQSRCLDICSESDFELAMMEKQGALYNEIVERYLKLFIEWNERLETLSACELEKFIMSEYKMATSQRYSFVDVHPENVLYDKGKLTIVDNAFNIEPEPMSTKGAKQMLLEDMINLFRDNISVTDIVSRKVFEQNSRIQDLYKTNQRVAGEAMHKFIKKANFLVSPSFYQKFAFNDVCYYLKKMLADEKAEQIIQDLQLTK